MIKAIPHEKKKSSQVIWDNLRLPRKISREAVAREIDAFGVEYIGESIDGCHVYCANMGDPYVETAIFCEDILHWGAWGDWVEDGRIKERN